MRVLYVFFVYSTRRFTVLVCLVILFFFGSATNTTSLFGQKLWLFTRGFLENYQFRHYFITDMRFYLFSYFMGRLNFDFLALRKRRLLHLRRGQPTITHTLKNRLYVYVTAKRRNNKAPLRSISYYGQALCFFPIKRSRPTSNTF